MVIDKEELRRIIHSFLGELSALAAATDLKALEDREFIEELREARELLLDEALTLEQVLITAVGITDEFFRAIEETAIESTLSFERDQRATE